MESESRILLILDYLNEKTDADHSVSTSEIKHIANDILFETLGIITSGYLKPDEALNLLMIGPEYIQVAMKTEKAAAHLRWIRSERIERPDAQLLEAEQEDFQRKFAEELAKLA